MSGWGSHEGLQVVASSVKAGDASSHGKWTSGLCGKKTCKLYGSWARHWAAKPGLVACCWALFGLEIGPAKMGLTLGPNWVMGLRPKNNR